MKVSKITTIPVQPRWLFVKMETDAGIVGYGECLGDKAMVVAEAVRSYEHHLIGEDPRRITHHWQSMYRGAFWRGGPTLCAAISGLEMCLWDILGKSLSAPVWQLLGGAVRDRIRVYTRPHGSTPEALAASAKEVVARGYTAMKLCPFDKVHVVDHYGIVEEAGRRVQSVREAVGNDIDIMLDFHGRVSPTMAMWLEEAVRPFHPMFIEEPVLPENVDALAIEIQEQNTRRARLNSGYMWRSTALADALPTVHGHVHSFWGEREMPDRSLLEARIALMRKARPDAEIEVFPGVGHWACYEAADRMNSELLRIISQP